MGKVYISLSTLTTQNGTEKPENIYFVFFDFCCGLRLTIADHSIYFTHQTKRHRETKTMFYIGQNLTLEDIRFTVVDSDRDRDSDRVFYCLESDDGFTHWGTEKQIKRKLENDGWGP